MFEWQFIGQNMKKRLIRTLLGAAVTAILFFLWGWILPDASVPQVITLLIGGCISLFYLLGIRTTIWVIGFSAVFATVKLLPSPWNAVGLLSIFIITPIQNLINKRRLKKHLLQSDPDITETQAAEIVATAGAVYSGSYDDVRREADAVMDAGFLMIESASLRHHKQYLLSPDKNVLVLYLFNQQQRMKDLLKNHSLVAFIPGDVQIDCNSIISITLQLKKRFGIEQLHIIVSTKEKNDTYLVTGSASARQVENFLTSHCDITVNNLVQTDREQLVQIPNIVENIRQADFETVKRMRSSRRINRLMTVLSALSLLFLVFWVRYPVLLSLMLLFPIAVTAFYIRRQEDVRFDGSRQGKPSVFFSYLCNPIFTVMFAWVIILEVLELTCLSQHLFTWLFGLLGAAVFLFCTIGFVRECRGKIGIKIGLAFMAAAFGAQITAVLLLLLHCG